MLAARRMMIGNEPLAEWWGIRSNTAQVITTHSALALVQSGVVFADASADLTPNGTNELALVIGAVGMFDPPGADGSYLFLRVGFDTGLWRFDRVSGVGTDTRLAFISMTGSGNYQALRSGSNVIVKLNGTTLATVTLTGSDAALLDNTIVGLRATNSGSPSAQNYTANGGTVADAFSRSDADMLGFADTGQPWVSTG